MSLEAQRDNNQNHNLFKNVSLICCNILLGTLFESDCLVFRALHTLLQIKSLKYLDPSFNKSGAKFCAGSIPTRIREQKINNFVSLITVPFNLYILK